MKEREEGGMFYGEEGSMGLWRCKNIVKMNEKDEQEF